MHKPSGSHLSICCRNVSNSSHVRPIQIMPSMQACQWYMTACLISSMFVASMSNVQMMSA